jgi:hypothetical protein
MQTTFGVLTRRDQRYGEPINLEDGLRLLGASHRPFDLVLQAQRTEGGKGGGKGGPGTATPQGLECGGCAFNSTTDRGGNTKGCTKVTIELPPPSDLDSLDGECDPVPSCPEVYGCTAIRVAVIECKCTHGCSGIVRDHRNTPRYDVEFERFAMRNGETKRKYFYAIGPCGGEGDGAGIAVGNNGPPPGQIGIPAWEDGLSVLLVSAKCDDCQVLQGPSTPPPGGSTGGRPTGGSSGGR